MDSSFHPPESMIAPGKIAHRHKEVRIVTILAGFLTAALSLQPAYAQGIQTEEQKSTISGTVINSVTRAPIPRALVSTNDNGYATFTDGSGHFEFELQKEDAESSPSVAEGFVNVGAPRMGRRLWLTARKPGFLIEGKQGQSAISGREATIFLTPEALIVGRISFSTPDTTSHVNIQLFWRQTQDGTPRWIQRESATTNSAGEFRFANLEAGSYKLATNESLDNDPGPMLSRDQLYGFPPLYFPNSPDFATAGTIEVVAGQTVEADLSLVRQPYFNVKIPVNGEMSGGVEVRVSSQSHRGPGYSLGYNSQEHRIEGMLPSGNYVVDATGYGETFSAGTTSLRVAGGPAVGPTLTMIPNNGIILNVKEEFSNTQPWGGSSTWTMNGRSVTMHGARTYLNAALEPADDFAQGRMGTLRPPVGPNDTSLVMAAVPPGRYWLRLSSGRGYVASATMGAIDVLRQPINISAGSSATIDITLRDDYASVEGTLTGSQSKNDDPDSQLIWIYFVPSLDSSGQFSQTTVQARQKFQSESMAPGNYRVLAFGHQQNLPYRDPQAMKAYETKGQLIHLAPGQKASLQIESVSEE